MTTEAPKVFERLAQAIAAQESVAQATVVTVANGFDVLPGAKLLVFDDGHAEGTLGDAAFSELVRVDALAQLKKGLAALLAYPGPAGSVLTSRGNFTADVPTVPSLDNSVPTTGTATTQVYVEPYLSPPLLLIIGAAHISLSLVKFAKELGFRVIVADARSKFATQERFPLADRVEIAWPDEVMDGLKLDSNTYVAILTHDEKFDVPAMARALNSEVRYIGAIGSRKTKESRMARLREQGFTEEQTARIHGPIGLKIGAETPEEIAISIMAEIIAVRHGKA